MSLAKTSGYFFSVLIFFMTIPLLGQKKAKGVDFKLKETPEEPFFQGMYIGTDLFGPVTGMMGVDYSSYEAVLQLNLKNKIFPVWEIGAGKGNTIVEDTELGLSTQSAMFNRIGLNYNMLNKKHRDFFFLGLRYGFSSFDYDFKNIVINSEYWNETYTGNPDTQSETVQWGEFLAGIQVRIISDIYMGWTIRYKTKWKEHADDDNLKPWYIPGYGTGTSHWGITFNVLYKLPVLK